MQYNILHFFEIRQSMNAIQSVGPMTIISETWNLPLTLELLSHIELSNRKYKVFMLESNPKNWIEQMRILQSSPTKNIADVIFHFDTKVSNSRLLLIVFPILN